MPLTAITPANVQAVIDSGQRNVLLDPRADYPEIAIHRPLNLTGSGPGTVVPKIRTVGYVAAVNIANLSVGAGGIQVVDGIDHLSLDAVSVDGTGHGAGVNITGYDSQPCLNVMLRGVRVRGFELGIVLGQVIRWQGYDNWIDRCQSATQPTDPSRHGLYCNDDNTVAGDNHGMLITRCPGTSYRGCGSRAYDCIAWLCGGSMAGSKNCEMMTRFTSIDSGSIEIGSQVPCMVEDPCGPIQIKDKCRSPWLQILRPCLAPGQVIAGQSRYPLPDQDVAGRFGQLTVTDLLNTPPITRTPATYCRDVLGGDATLESLWTKPFKVAEMNRWIRETA